MGSLKAHEAATVMTDMVGKEMAMEYHLRHNHFPPVPKEMVPMCIEAAETYGDDPDRLIDLPEGTTWKGGTQAPVWAIVEGHHLEPFVEEWGSWG